ncbi:Uncharacterised protein [Mycobacteroides abscessus subsp. abscessus]|nr:Uncharacterised protein [Mycobacteroides abscessus subsp. abscessus]
MRCLKPDAVSGMSTSTTAPCDGTTPAAFIEVKLDISVSSVSGPAVSSPHAV